MVVILKWNQWSIFALPAKQKLLKTISLEDILSQAACWVAIEMIKDELEELDDLIYDVGSIYIISIRDCDKRQNIEIKT